MTDLSSAQSLPPFPDSIISAPKQSLPPFPETIIGAQNQSRKPSLLSEAVKPITDLPGTYSDMVHEAMARFGKGVNEIKSGDYLHGAGNAALSALDYASAPISAPIHTIIGEPTHNAVAGATGNEKAGQFAGDLAETAASLALPIPKSIPRIGGAAEKIAAPAAEDLKAAAKSAFQHPEVDRLAIKPKAVQDWKDVLTANLNSDGFDENLAPKTFGVLSQLDKAPAGSTVTGKNLQSLRRMLSRAAGTIDPTERAAAAKAIDALDSFVTNVPKTAILRGDPAKVASIWNDARGNYAAAKRSETVSGQVENAELNAASANSGQNIDNATRQQIKAILKSRRLKRGYSQEELAQMRRVITGTFKGDAARYFSNVFGKGGGLGTLHAAATGGIAGGLAFGPPGAVAGVMTPLMGYGLAKISNHITAKEVEKLQNLIRSRSPLAQQLRNPIEQYGKASTALRGSTTPQNLARLLIASRNLSNNLKDAGIVVAPDKLVGAIQPPQDRQRQSGVTITPVQSGM